jgi:hypothetical protein
MKFLKSLQATVAVEVSADDVTPEKGLAVSDLIQFVGDSYNFSTRHDPSFPAPLVFQNGVHATESARTPIMQLAILGNGDMVTASSTDDAELVLDDFMKRLDQSLHYRFAGAKQKKFYLSGIVIEFDSGLDEKIEVLHKIGTLLESHIPRPDKPFKLKRLAFGFGNPMVLLTNVTLQLIQNADFTFERRAGEPYSANRYFSQAPMRTADHVKLVEKIEAEAFR